jgi:hypothetical protein
MFVAFMTIASKPTPLPVLDDQFSLNRQMLPDNAAEAMRFPLQVGNFKRNGKLASRNGYDYVLSNGTTITLTLKFIASGHNLNSLGRNISSCGDFSINVRQYLEAKFPYAFSGCGGYKVSWISWVNGKWLIEAVSSSSLPSAAHDFLEFVNTYPY